MTRKLKVARTKHEIATLAQHDPAGRIQVPDTESWDCHYCGTHHPHRKGVHAPYKPDGSPWDGTSLVKICRECKRKQGSEGFKGPRQGPPTPMKEQLDRHPRLFDMDKL